MTPTPMTPLQMVIAIVISAVITFSLRALPFVIFHGNRKMPKWLERIEKSLPAMIMSILIIYCLKDIGDNMFGVGIPRLLAVVITGGSYKLWHNTFVSMAAGTLSYMGLLYLFSHVLTMAKKKKNNFGNNRKRA